MCDQCQFYQTDTDNPCCPVCGEFLMDIKRYNINRLIEIEYSNRTNYNQRIEK